MKALKEKRLSLRSLIRGGLVILSLFAIVLAIGCNSTEPDPGDTSNTGSPIETTAPTLPYALAIVVQVPPTAVSFQGLQPDMNGAVVRVVWSNGGGAAEYIPGDKLASRGFFPVEYCDIAGVGTGLGEFHIGHSNGVVTSLSNGFQLPGVIGLTGLAFTNSGTIDWYADQRPDFEKLGLRGQYDWVVDKDGKVRWGVTNPTETPADDPSQWDKRKSEAKNIPITEGYPAMDRSMVAISGSFKVGIGYSSAAGSYGSLKWIDKAGLFGTTGTGHEYDWVVGANAKFYKIESVKFTGSEGEFSAFDDDTDLADSTIDGGVAKGNAAKLKKAQTAKPKFEVTYEGGKKQTLTWDDFYYNVWYTLGVKPTADYLFYSVGTKNPSASTNTDYVPETLAFNEDDQTWPVLMKYVPKDYGTSDITYDGTVKISLPVYTFSELQPNPVQKGDNLLVLYKDGINDIDTLDTVSTGKLLTAIKDKWTLTGMYESADGKQYPKTLKFDKDMFNKANFSGGTNGVILTSPELRAAIANASGTASGLTLIGENFALPLVYRGEPLSEDETVLVDIYFDF